MDNNSPVPVKTKIAAWLLIGLGVCITAAFIYSLFSIPPGQELKAEALPLVYGLASIALIIAVFSFLAGLPFFARQKIRLLKQSLLVFLAAYATIFALLKGLVALFQSFFYDLGCPDLFYNEAAQNAPTCLANAELITFNLDFLFISTTGAIIIGGLAFILIMAGRKILKLNNNWRKTAIALMAINILTMGNTILLPLATIDNFLGESMVFSVAINLLSLGFSLAVILLLLLDKKHFSTRTKD
ncbi:MAG TPA: hypothetical protein P5080_03660 [Candidatus Paceibacterota bacterium]|nr:hypothetical protein [Candidatus Pacearchaeota archaeon]HRZ51060.1 hypothetical protein [Candidatus Paceibacterota bacterium]HSA36781.1 hypothetical protein [Candidatus Paceibacterota bacterium]